MKRIPGEFGRRVLAASAVVALASVSVSACGGGGSEAAEDSASPEPSRSSSPKPSSEPSAAGAPGSAADGECGGGEFKTKVVKAARGVQLTVPADWKVKSARAGAAVGLYPPDPDVGDGYVLVQTKDQTLDEAVDDALKVTADSAKTTSEQDLDLAGFDGARMVTFEYDDSDDTYAVDVVAVAGTQRVAVNMTRDGAPEEQATVESCLSTLSRTP